jgi:hypothetical protein
MMRKLKVVVLILIILVGMVTIYLAIKNFQLRPNSMMIDSFAFSSAEGDTLRLNYPLDEVEIKDILFLIHCYSTEYGGESFSITSVRSGELAFGRMFEIQDSSLIYKNHRIRIGETLENTLTYNSKQNIFKRVTNRLVIKNKGFIKAALMDFPGEQRILFKKPILLVTGNSYDSFIIKSKLMVIYKKLPYVLIVLGIMYWLLIYLTKREKRLFRQKNF